MSSLVSVIIPIRNRSELFSETARSLTSQTHQHWEAIVVDDGSDPIHRDHIQSIVAGDSRMRLVPNPGPRTGASAARNAGVSSSTGEYILFFDSDDILSPTCIEQRLSRLHRDPTVDAAVSKVGFFKTKPGDLEKSLTPSKPENDLDRFLRFDIPWQTMGAMWRRDSLRRFHLQWDESALSWQDWEFHIRAVAAGLRISKSDEVDCYWRKPTPLGSTGRKHFSRRHIINRLRLIGRIADELVERGLMTPYRRRIVRVIAFQHAFHYGLMLPDALLAWRISRCMRLITMSEYLTGLACEGVRRSCIKFENFLYPPGLYLRP
jgi:Glycosyltransferases involved in cell wall biogenesis